MDIPIFTGIQFKEKAEIPLKNQKSYIDKKHLEYWDECIDTEYKPVDMKLEENLIAPAVEKVIEKDA